jgi:hypothetical protein
LIAAGLLCFAAWRLTQAVLDADDCGTSLEELARRGIYAGSALFYLAFAWVAVNMLFGSDRKDNSDQIAREWSAWLLAKPFGQWVATFSFGTRPDTFITVPDPIVDAGLPGLVATSFRSSVSFSRNGALCA